MRKIRDVLRLHYAAKLSIRQIQTSTKISLGQIHKLLVKAEEMGLEWPLPDHLDDTQLARMFYPGSDSSASGRFVVPVWSEVHQELKRKEVTLQLLWEEYTHQYPNRCYSYSQYCERYCQWKKKQRRSMRQAHKAGEKCFVDYCGPTLSIVDHNTGEVREAQVFVGVLGASNYTYAEATRTQSLQDWLGSHVRMLEYYGGCPEIIVPDNLKSGVSKACRYDPDLNPAYQQWAAHYDVAIIPARPYAPKDKAKAEVAVQIVERWIMARLRKQTFFSLAEANRCIRALLDELNLKPFKQLPGNRLQAFNQLDRPALKPLSRQAYHYVDIKPVRVNIDYHVQYKQHHYSVPHQFVGESLELHASDQLITLFFRQQQVACHPRKHHPGMTTDSGHMPVRHQKHHQWTPERLRSWGKSIGPETYQWIDRQLTLKDHPEQAYRVCLGLLNLSREFSSVRLESACQIANREDLMRLRHVKSILKSNRDQLSHQEACALSLPQDHDNIRGPGHFH
jgi:transposase